jgi:hypothetical protein
MEETSGKTIRELINELYVNLEERDRKMYEEYLFHLKVNDRVWYEEVAMLRRKINDLENKLKEKEELQAAHLGQMKVEKEEQRHSGKRMKLLAAVLMVMVGLWFFP